jgi:hypothetical protein
MTKTVIAIFRICFVPFKAIPAEERPSGNKHYTPIHRSVNENLRTLRSCQGGRMTRGRMT